jgi:hypothetical protein
MLQIIRNAKSVKVIALGAVCAALFSFNTPFGGEGFEIYLNNKLVVQHYGTPTKAVKNLQLDESSYNDQLTIKYHHCGRVGKNRIVTLKDEKNNVLKQWNFANANDATNAMTCKVKDIIDLQKKNGSKTINLFYSSSELPEGRLLAALTSGNNKLTKL